MLKTKKKIITALIVLLLLVSTTCLAATTSSEKAKLEIVENNVCTIKMSETATFEKKIVDYNLEKKELTIGLRVTNTAEPITNAPYEIVFVIDNSESMKQNEVRDGVTRLQEVTNSAKTLATKLLENENTQISVVSFSTSTHKDAEGHVDREGTLEDAILRNELTSDSTTILASIDKIATDDLQGPRTNIDAGLQIAQTCFSKENNNKYIILLTDGVPNTAVGGITFTYSAETATKTKATLKALDDAGINVISAMIGLNPSVVESTTNLTYKALAEEIFGTQENPTVGQFYYVADKDIEDSICETIYSNIVDTTSTTLTNVDIYDYFPQEIIDNFDFSYVASPTLGTVSSTLDLENRRIIWHIDELGPQASGNLSYKLTLKPEIDEKIIDVVLDTNEKVDITANEITTEDGSNTLTSDVTPKVKVTLDKPETPVQPDTPDTTVAPEEIPQTGISSTSMLVFSIVVIAGIAFGIRYYLISKKIK